MYRSLTEEAVKEGVNLLFTSASALGLLALVSTANAGLMAIPNGDGLFNVEAWNIVGGGGSNDNDLNNMAETDALQAVIDGATTKTGPQVVGSKTYNVQNHYKIMTTDAQDYAGGGGNFGINNPYSNIGPAGLGGDDFSIRTTAFLEFTQAGTYTIGAGSDDGRRITLFGLLEGGNTGFSAQGGQVDAGGVGTNTIGFNGTTGHNSTRGAFSVAAGEVLFLDAAFFERGGGDSWEVFIGQGNTVGTGPASSYQVLQDGVFGINISSTPEPSSASVLGAIGVAGLFLRRRRK